MSSESPAAIIYSSLGVELSVPNSNTILASQPGLMIDGYNYSTGLAQLLAVDSSGHSIVVGSGVSGTPAGGVLTVQGVSGGTALTVNNATAANLLANVGGIGAAGSAPSGNPIYIGASVTTSAPTYTTATMNALSLTTSGLLRVDGTGGVFNSQSVSGTAATTPSFATLAGGAVTTSAPTYTTGQMDPLSLTTAGALRVDGSGVNQPVVGIGTAGTPSGGVLTVQGAVGGTAIPVSGTFTTNKSTTGTLTTVVASTSSVQLLASNSSRVGAAFYNDSPTFAYLAVSATTASLTAFTIKLWPNTYTDLDLDYTGAINCIWAAGASGNMRITEWS